MKQTVIVEGMKCEGCSNTVTRLFSELAGVENVTVNRETKTASVEATESITKETFSEALAGTKFTVSDVK